MNQTVSQSSSNLVSLTYIIYGLHLFSAINGLLGTAFIVTAFLSGWPSIIAVILNYLKQDEARGTYLESHFRWQIRTFWFGFLWIAIGAILFVTVILIPVAWVMLVVVGIWILYRLIRGLMSLLSEQSMPMV